MSNSALTAPAKPPQTEAAEIKIVNHNNRLIPTCNLHDPRKNTHLYIPDKIRYSNEKRKNDKLKEQGIMAGVLLAVFFTIFTLNFGSSGWTLGNLLTLGVVFFIILQIYTYGKGWNESRLWIQTMEKSGRPCKIVKDNTHTIHCGR